VKELSLAQVDFEQVLYRLALHARHLITAAKCLGVEDLVLPGGDSPVDLASATLLKFLDPGDVSVVWSENKEPPTTAGLVAFLRVVLERDFLDLVRSRRYRDATYPDHNDPDLKPQEFDGDWFDSIATASTDPEHEAVNHKTSAWLLKQFREDPDLQAILQLQLEMDGYNAFSNLELARMLAVPVAEIENRKRRLKTRLKSLASGRQMKGAKHG
jgi:DNA-directed RNA polymerase specialized sigma24 family protein